MSEPKVTMFAGKGGVGKTTCACATALHYAAKQQTMVFSTDPTPSLCHIFEANCEQKPFQISDKLFISEIGVEEVKHMWDGKFGREVYGVFSSFVAVEYKEFVDFVSSILPGLRDEFMVDYIREISKSNTYQRIIWDTAPLGQTLGLLKMPEMLGKHLKLAPRIYSKLKTGSDARRPVLDILKGWEKLSAMDMDFLQNEVGFVIVTIPEALAIEQLDGTFYEFNRYGFTVDRLIINNVIEDTSSDFLHIKALQQRNYIDLLYDKYPNLKITELPMFPNEIKGINKLREIESRLFVQSD
jgi:arsenite-transporting ATPase